MDSSLVLTLEVVRAAGGLDGELTLWGWAAMALWSVSLVLWTAAYQVGNPRPVWYLVVPGLVSLVVFATVGEGPLTP